MISKDLFEAAGIAINVCLGVQPGETVLIITDEPCRKIGQALWLKAKEAQAEAILLEMLPRQSHGQEPPELVAQAMLKANVILAPTSKSISHTTARKAACNAGARITTLPGITEEIMIRTLRAYYFEIKEVTLKIADWITGRKFVKLTSLAGTDLTLSIEGRKVEPDYGILRKNGEFSNLPAGEVYIAPVEGTASGKIVIDGSMAGIGLLEEPLFIEVKNGYATDITGVHANKLLKLIDRFGPEARNIAELGIGTNNKAQLSGNVLEDEKIRSTVHIALGDNHTFGGQVTVPSHLDGVILQPTLIIDNETLIKNGQLILE